MINLAYTYINVLIHENYKENKLRVEAISVAMNITEYVNSMREPAKCKPIHRTI